MNAKADNAKLESLSAPLTPLVSAENEVIENFPTDLKTIQGMNSTLPLVLNF